MNRLLLVVIALLLANPSTSTAGDPLDVRYRDAAGRMSLTLDQDISVSSHESIAGRKFSFDLAMATDSETSAVTIVVDRARATYSAHDMEQRLGTHSVKGRTIPLAIALDGRQLEPPAEASADPPIHLDAIVESGLSVGGVLVDTMPVLPDSHITVGTTWTTERPVRTLEGWAWATGWMTSRHRAVGFDRDGGRTVISVQTEAAADLSAVEGGRAYTGTLTRTLHWKFDATAGRLLSLSMEQETEGETALPQGDVAVRQTTRLELTPLT